MQLQIINLSMTHIVKSDRRIQCRVLNLNFELDLFHLIQLNQDTLSSMVILILESEYGSLGNVLSFLRNIPH